MQMKVKTPSGTISAAYLHDMDGNTVGIHAGKFACDSVVSLEFSNKYGGLCLIINHDELNKQGIKLVDRLGGWDGKDI